MKQIRILFNYIFGFVTIIVEGYFIEKFINICISKGILIWNIDRQKSSMFKARVGIQDFKKIKYIAKTSKCRVKIKDKKGLPFLFYKYKKRKIFIICLVIIFGFIMFSSSFVWNIEIIGESKIPKEEIVSTLAESGLKIGLKKKEIDKNQVISDFRLKRDDVAWIGITMRGTNVIVEIVDHSPKPEIVNIDEFCSVVSDKQGVIAKIIVQEGTPCVKVGDTVEIGTLLVGGWMEGQYTGIKYLHAQATIEANICYSKREKIYLNTEENRRNGKQENKYTIKLNNFKINLYKTVTKFKSCDTIQKENKLKIFSQIYLPISIIKNTNYEIETVPVTYTIEEAKKVGVEKLSKELELEIQNFDSILNKQINYSENEEFVEVEVIYEVQEAIGVEEKI